MHRLSHTLVLALLSLLLWQAWGSPRTIAATPEATPVSEAPDAKDLGKLLGPRFATHRTDHFELVHCADQAWAGRAGKLLEQTHDHFYQAMKQAGFSLAPVRERLVWVCFGNADEFAAYARSADRMDMSWLDGYYSGRTNRVALVLDAPARPARPAGPTIGPLSTAGSHEVLASVGEGPPGSTATVEIARALHEAAHQLAFNSGVQKRGVMYPLWVSEGLATQLEMPDGGLGQDNPARRKRLLDALAHNKLVPLKHFLAMTRAPLVEDDSAVTVYAQAWGMLGCVQKTQAEGLKRYLAALAKLGPGWRDEATLLAEITEAFGPVKQLEVAWNKYLRELKK